MLRFVEAPFRLLGCLEIVPEWIYSSIRIPNTETVIEGVDFSPKREILTSTGTMSADRWLGLRAPLRSSRWRMRWTRLYPGTCPARPSRLFWGCRRLTTPVCFLFRVCSGWPAQWAVLEREHPSQGRPLRLRRRPPVSLDPGSFLAAASILSCLPRRAEARAESIWRAGLGVVVLPSALASVKGYSTSVKDGQDSEVCRRRQG